VAQSLRVDSALLQPKHLQAAVCYQRAPYESLPWGGRRHGEQSGSSRAPGGMRGGHDHESRLAENRLDLWECGSVGFGSVEHRILDALTAPVSPIGLEFSASVCSRPVERSSVQRWLTPRLPISLCCRLSRLQVHGPVVS
jgi:hypothetical protein